MRRDEPCKRLVLVVEGDPLLRSNAVGMLEDGGYEVRRSGRRYGGNTMGLINKILGQASDLTSDQARQELDGVLLPDEPVEVAFKVVRDLFVFTDRRLILVDKQSLTGRKVEYLIIPYRAITTYSIENAGTFDMDSELKIWISGRAEPIQKVLKSGANIRGIQAAIASAL